MFTESDLTLVALNEYAQAEGNMMIKTKLKLKKNISKNLISLEASSRITVQCQSGLSGQRVFYIYMSEHQAGKKIVRNPVSDLRELPVCKQATI